MNGRGLILIGVGLFVLVGGFVVYQKIRGIRNKNPGNVRAVPNQKFLGQVGVDDKGFIIFDTPENGVRALARVLKTYQNKHGLKTVADMIARWAPSNENDTAAYIASVSNRIGIAPTQRFTFNDDILTKMVNAIIKHENDVNPYDALTIEKGIKSS